MSCEHHGDNLHGDPELVKLFRDQLRGEAVRKWPGGRMGGDDDGQLAYAIATDKPRGAIMIKFPKQVEWLGLDVQSATTLRDQLTERILELRGITV